MARRSKVVWSEGMFLRTQHFQQQDRYTGSLIRDALAMQPHQTFGFSRLELDRNALESGLFGLTVAEGVFADGTFFAIPDSTVPLKPVKIERGADDGVISLAIPAESEGAAAIDPEHAESSGARWRGEMAAIRDEVKGGGETEDLELARLAPVFLLPGQETSGYVTLPVARLQGLDASGAVTLDHDFLAPALNTAALPFYAAFAQEVVTGLDRITEAHGQIVLSGSGASVENLLILELANSARPRMAHFLAQNDFHPSEYFMELAGLAGRMATFGSSSRRLTEFPVYDHDDPQPAFSALADTLRSLLLSLRHVEQKSRALKVSRHSENVWTIRIDNPEIVKNSRIVLRVGGDMSEQMLRKLFVNQTTVGAADEFDKLWTTRLTGIPLKPLHSQPREIPYDGDRLCLELDRNSEHWAHLSDAPGFVVGVSGKLEREPEIDCYAVSR